MGYVDCPKSHAMLYLKTVIDFLSTLPPFSCVDNILGQLNRCKLHGKSSVSRVWVPELDVPPLTNLEQNI